MVLAYESDNAKPEKERGPISIKAGSTYPLTQISAFKLDRRKGQ